MYMLTIYYTSAGAPMRTATALYGNAPGWVSSERVRAHGRPCLCGRACVEQGGSRCRQRVCVCDLENSLCNSRETGLQASVCRRPSPSSFVAVQCDVRFICIRPANIPSRVLISSERPSAAALPRCAQARRRFPRLAASPASPASSAAAEAAAPQRHSLCACIYIHACAR